MQTIYLLKDLSKLSGCPTHTLKYYLSIGLLKEIGRSKETNIRYFNDGTHQQLKKIQQLQKKNLTLKQIQEKFEHEESIQFQKLS
ncbi:MAG: MerR family transcriptional regulator [Candidatus Omnitrophica bacterium]|nr:MerR family transcriptional regulator [Candidatus Omnitrophota bacterium]